MFSKILWLSLGGALGYWLCTELATWLLSWLTPALGIVDALLWTQLTQLILLILLAFGLLQLARRQKSLHALAGAVLLPLAVIVSWSGTLSLYRAELDLALTPALAPARAVEMAPAQQLELALQWQQQQAPTAAQLYVEFASARKPYLTLHLQQPGSWTLTRHWLQLPTDSAQTSLTALGEPLELKPGNSRHSIGELFFSLHYQLAGLLKRAAQPLLIGLSIAVLALTLSGLYLLWQRWRQAGTTQLFSHVLGHGPLRWHLAGGIAEPALVNVVFWLGTADTIRQLAARPDSTTQHGLLSGPVSTAISRCQSISLGSKHIGSGEVTEHAGLARRQSAAGSDHRHMAVDGTAGLATNRALSAPATNAECTVAGATAG